jgi:hypothetical protein
VTPSGGDENPPLEIVGLSIETVCGPDSTVLTAPSLTTLMLAVEANEIAIQEASFISSNTECPIELISTDSAGFTITHAGGDYMARLGE